MQNLFKQGKVGMMITAPFLSSQIKDEAPDLKYGVAPIPAGPGGDRGTYGVTDSIIMFKNSQEQGRGLEVPRLSCSPPNGAAKFTQGEGFLPVNKEEAQDATTSSTMPI